MTPPPSRGKVSLQANRRPRAERLLFPDSPAAASVLKVYWLEVNDTLPGQKEFMAECNRTLVLGQLAAIDRLLGSGGPPPTRFLTKITHRNVDIWEIKTPPSGKDIYRLLAVRETGWTLFVATARKKTTQRLPSEWLDVAARRIRDARSGGAL